MGFRNRPVVDFAKFFQPRRKSVEILTAIFFRHKILAGHRRGKYSRFAEFLHRFTSLETPLSLKSRPRVAPLLSAIQMKEKNLYTWRFFLSLFMTFFPAQIYTNLIRFEDLARINRRDARSRQQFITLGFRRIISGVYCYACGDLYVRSGRLS